MIRPVLAAGALGVLLSTTSAHALEAPAPGPRDKRVRVVAYDPDEVVQLYAAPGSTIRIAIALNETVEAVLVSDQTLMSGEVEAETPGAGEGSPRQVAPANLACDANICRSVVGSFLYFKPVRELEPQPLFVQTKRCEEMPAGAPPKCASRPYQFELVTRLGPLTEQTPNTFYAVRFDYPADRAAAEQAAAAAAAARARAAAAARQAAAVARWREARAKAGEEALRSQQPAVVNKAYTVQGDRAVLGTPK